MSDAISLSNLVLYSLQVLLVVLTAALAAAVFRVDAAHVRYAYWRAVALLCLALPWLQPRFGRVAPIEGQIGIATDMSVAQAAVGATGEPGPALSLVEVLVWIVLVGVVMRLAWFGTGLLKLRALRRTAYVAGPAGEHDDLQQTIGTRAQLRYSDRVTQPVTFGLVRPLVLLPSALLNYDEDVRRAVVVHELLHVRRRDWAWVLGEELMRAVCWFHPAIWWLISRVQLAREEVVDELAVLVTGRRRTYVEALLAFADQTPLAPAPAFARRRHLFRRMLLISKEADMSPKQIVASCAVMAVIVAGGGWYAARAFPLVGAPQEQHEMVFSPAAQDGRGPLERSAVPITPENPVPRRVSVVHAEYPAEAVAAGVTARISVQITLDETGGVAEARVRTIDVNNPRAVAERVTAAVDASAGAVQFEGAEAQQLGEAFKASALAAVRQWRYDPPYQAPISFPVTISFSLGATENSQGVPPPPPPAPRKHQIIKWTPDGVLHVDGAGDPPRQIKHVAPVYPPLARAAGIAGVVVLEAVVGPEGRITHARVLRSLPLLDQAALDAVKQWEFTPTLLNGEPVPVLMTLTIDFRLP